MTVAKEKQAPQWRPGQSGNPKGRKPGTGEVAKLRASIAKDVPAIVKKLVEQAKSGDVSASRLLLERTIAPLRPSDEVVILQLPAEASLTEQGRAVLHAVASGGLSPTQGAAVLGGLGTLGKLIETEDLVRRVAALEGKANGKS